MRTVGIILEAADKSVPTDLLEKILEHKPNVFAYSICEMGQKFVEFSNTSEDIPTAEQWANLRAGQQFKSQKVVTWYGYDKDIQAEEAQPFTLLHDEKKRPLVVAFLDANLEHRKKTTAHEFILSEIGPMVDVYNEIAEGDIAKLMKGLLTDAFKKQVMDKLPNGGSLILHSTDGIAVIGESNQDYIGDWGYCSQTYGWKPAEAAPKSETEPVKTSFLDNLKARSAGAASAVTHVVAETSKNKLKNSTSSTEELIEAANATLRGGGSSSKDGMIFPPEELVAEVKKHTKGSDAYKKAVRNLADFYNNRCPKKGFSLDRDLKGWREGCGIPAAGTWQTNESFMAAFRKFNSSGSNTENTGKNNISVPGPDVNEVRKKINDAAETRNNIYNTFMDQENVKKIYDMKSFDLDALKSKMYYPANDPLKDIRFDQWTWIAALERDDLKLLADQSDWLIDMIYKYAHLALVLLEDNSKLRIEKQKANETSSVLLPTAEEKQAVAEGTPVPKRRSSMF